MFQTRQVAQRYESRVNLDVSAIRLEIVNSLDTLYFGFLRPAQAQFDSSETALIFPLGGELGCKLDWYPSPADP